MLFKLYSCQNTGLKLQMSTLKLGPRPGGPPLYIYGGQHLWRAVVGGAGEPLSAGAGRQGFRKVEADEGEMADGRDERVRARRCRGWTRARAGQTEQTAATRLAWRSDYICRATSHLGGAQYERKRKAVFVGF